MTAPPRPPFGSDEYIATLIDQRRALSAALAGKEIEIAMAVGDRDGAIRALREMNAQTVARLAARQHVCPLASATRTMGRE